MSGSLAAANVYRFSSKEWDGNSGLYYYLYRFYDPNLQRWLNRDPLGEFGFQTLSIRESFLPPPLLLNGTLIVNNLYCLVQDAPINDFDPDGRVGLTTPIKVVQCLYQANKWEKDCKKKLPKPSDYDCEHQADYFDAYNDALKKCVDGMQKVFKTCLKAAY
jgi:RHS repeat-associated protein